MAKILYAYVNDTLIAEKEYEFYLCFDSLLENYDRYMILCHLYDPQFFLEYYLPEICLSPLAMEENVKPSFLLDSNSISTMRRKIRTFKMKFPSHLAGGTFRLDFVLQKMNSLEAPKINPDYGVKTMQEFLMNIYSPQIPIPMKIPVDNNRFSVDVTIESPSGPSITYLYWGDSEEIKYGEEPTKRMRSDTTVYANERLHAHIQTEGLYGRDIQIAIRNSPQRYSYRVQDNTMVISGLSGNFYDSSKRIFSITPYIKNMPYNKQITPSLSYNSQDSLNIKAPKVSAANVMTDAEKDDWEKYSNCECRVDFRPTKKYDGSFGFSWFRTEDTNTKNSKTLNDCSFLNHIGYQYDTYGENSKIITQDINKYNGIFKVDTDMIDRHIKEYHRIEMPLMLQNGVEMESRDAVKSGKYLVPQMTIRKGITAELKLYLQKINTPSKFSFQFSNPVAEKEGYLTINKKELNSISPDETIKIECKKEFSKAVNLDVYAYPEDNDEGKKELCGSVRILPNDIMHQRNIDLLFVNVSYRNKKGQSIIDNMNDYIPKYFNQAYLNFHITTINIVLDDRNDPYVIKYFQSENSWPSEVIERIFIPNSDIIRYEKTDDLDKVLIKLTQNISSVNCNSFKLAAIPFETMKRNGSYIGGYSVPGTDLVVCYEGGTVATPTHELGHALGLPHTFTGCTSWAKYVYESKKTDNFMDYCHHINVERLSFFNWQWKVMNALME